MSYNRTTPRAQVLGSQGEGVTSFFLRTKDLGKQCLDLFKGAGRPEQALRKRAANGIPKGPPGTSSLEARRYSTPFSSSRKGWPDRPGPRPRLDCEDSGGQTVGASRGRGTGGGGAAQAPPQACARGRAPALAAPPGRGSPRPCFHCEGEGRRRGEGLRRTLRLVPGALPPRAPRERPAKACPRYPGQNILPSVRTFGVAAQRLLLLLLRFLRRHL